MLISFILFANQDSKKVFKTLSSIVQQDSDNYELIVIEDTGYSPNSILLEGLLEKQSEFGSRMHILTNAKGQGYAYGINAVLRYAQGKYIIFTSDGQTFERNFVSKIEKLVSKWQNAPDLIEFELSYSDYPDLAGVVLPKIANKIIHINREPKVLAYTNPILYNKLFNLELLKLEKIKIRNYLWYQALFLYQFLSVAKNYYSINLKLSSIILNDLKYSVFDLIKQWVHIFNFYREVNLYKIYQNELDYAYARFLLIDFVQLVSHTCNHKLALKAFTSAHNKMTRRSKHLNSNPYLVNSSNELITIADDIDKYYKTLKDNSIKS